jgi:type III restriction enzyme
VHETARRKLLRIRPAKNGPRLDVQFVSNGKYDDTLEQKHTGGFTCWGLGDDGTIQSVHHNDMESVVKYLVQDNLHTA